MGLGLMDKSRTRGVVFEALRSASRPLLVASHVPCAVLPPGRAAFPLWALNDTMGEWRGGARWELRVLEYVDVVVAEPFDSRQFVDDFGGDAERREWAKWQARAYGGGVRGALVVGGPAGAARVAARGAVSPQSVPCGASMCLGHAEVVLAPRVGYELVVAWRGADGAEQHSGLRVLCLAGPAGPDEAYGLAPGLTRVFSATRGAKL